MRKVPDTFELGPVAGFRQSIGIPALGRKMESQMIAIALGIPQHDTKPAPTKKIRAGGDKLKAAFPAAKQLRANEQKQLAMTPL